MDSRTEPTAAIPVVALFYLALILGPSHHLTLLVTGTIAITACWLIAGRCGVDAAAGRQMLVRCSVSFWPPLV